MTQEIKDLLADLNCVNKGILWTQTDDNYDSPLYEQARYNKERFNKIGKLLEKENKSFDL